MPFDLSTATPVEPTKGGFDIATAKPVAEPQPDRPVAEQAIRAVGRTARAGIQGVGNLVGTLANVPAVAYNAVADLYDSARAPKLGELVTGKPKGFRFPDQTQAGVRVADALGLPKAENENERVAEDVAAGMAGAGGMVGLGRTLAGSGNALAQSLGKLFSTGPGTQVVSGGTGSGAASVVRESGGSPEAQMAAGVAGALAPSAGTMIADAARRIVRGGEAGRLRVGQNIDTFEGAGAGTPTVGQATENRVVRAVESMLAKMPGSSGTMVNKATSEAAGMGNKIQAMAATIAPRSGAETAGRSIAGGIRDFVKDFKAKASAKYSALDQFILPDTQIRVNNAARILDDLTTVTPGAENLSMQAMNPKIVAIRGALADDAPNGLLPYGAVKELRTRVGDMLESHELVSGAPRAQLKKLYGALTSDMEAAAQAAGPEAVHALRRANKFYAAGMKRIDDVLEPILQKGDPEEIFKAAVSGTKEGATTIRGVMRSLPDDSKKVVAATMMRRLGKATPGNQNELGEVFSAETFLTNWNRIDPQARKSLFGSLPSGMRSDLDKIAEAAANIREGSKVFSNPSGTGQVVSTHMTSFAAIIAALNGNILPAAGIAAAPVVSKVAADKLLTNPVVVKWLAKAATAPAEQIPAQLNVLFQNSMGLPKSERRDVRALIDATRENLRAEGDRP